MSILLDEDTQDPFANLNLITKEQCEELDLVS